MMEKEQIEKLAKTLADTMNPKDMIELLVGNLVNALSEHCYEAGYRKHLSPCDACKYSPPSSGDGKPCLICPACAKIEEEEQK